MMIEAAKTFISERDRWLAVVNRDATADGRFYFSVRTTGVYCRPNCGARQPLRENVAFHETREAAEAAGFRACKRCKPDRAGAMNDFSAQIEAACRHIETAETMPTLAELANAAQLSTYYFHRVFKQYTGVTPKAYGQAHRGRKVQHELKRGASVTDALYEAGYQASSRFYEDSQQRLGMTPGQFRRGAPGELIRYMMVDSLLGLLLVAATQRGICLIHFGETEAELKALLEDQFPRATLVDGDETFNQWVQEVHHALSECRPANANLPLDIRGTAFQQQVWQALREIPMGETVSYSSLAQKIGKPKAARAVARACASNQLAVVVPCHRVVRANGDLSGYRWGQARKRQLLDREASQ